MWGLFCLGPRQADVGVGQGSALLPVLSALYIAPVLKLYHMNPVSLKTSLLSFVDDGTVAAQSKSLHENIETLKEAYTLLLSLFVTLGLVLEHSKTEYFIFDQSHSDYSPPLDLGYAPYTGDNPLKPNLYWRYLGFYFDHKLLFHEHICFYSSKALLSVKAMKMLGSSTRGLPLREKHLLYCSCVEYFTLSHPQALESTGFYRIQRNPVESTGCPETRKWQRFLPNSPIEIQRNL